MNVPRLRFKEFSGEWKVERLGNFIVERNEYPEDKLPIFSLTIENGVTPKTERYERAFLVNDEENAYKVVLKDDFAYNPMNLRFGAIAKYSGDNPVVVSKYYNIFHCKNTVNTIFCELYFKSYNMIMFYNKMATGSLVEKKRVHFGEFIKFKIPFPSLPEQTKIANFLTAVNEKIAQLTQKSDLLGRYKKGVMQKIFSQQLRFKDDDGQEFPEWEIKSFGEIATFSKGKGISKAEIDENGTTFCIRYGELYTEYNETIRNIKSKTNSNVKNLVLSEINDVIIPASGETQIDIAKASCVQVSGVALGGDLNIIKSQENGVFLTYYLNNQKKLDIAKLAQGNSVVHLYSSQLKLLILNLPDKKEQTKIANFLTVLDDKISYNQTQLNALKRYKQGLLQQLFV